MTVNDQDLTRIEFRPFLKYVRVMKKIENINQFFPKFSFIFNQSNVPLFLLIHEVLEEIDEIKLSFQSYGDFKSLGLQDIESFGTVAFHRMGKGYQQLPKNQNKTR